ncbi:protein of unknown function DUF1996 [Macrophomina phaseolina MS6]|uniref:Uncharacterized protein n=1 Tax=Macrophomina phaseolina (strain MS6) TaxID=1126212 RepID=K2QIH4_MACPH|nr:protein of unknown function DUF1996 [Macrophomina phaseolina MS6]
MARNLAAQCEETIVQYRETVAHIPWITTGYYVFSISSPIFHFHGAMGVRGTRRLEYKTERLAIVKKEKRKKRNFSRVRRRPGLMYRLVLCKQMHIETIQRSKESVALLAPYVRTLPCATTR